MTKIISAIMIVLLVAACNTKYGEMGLTGGVTAQPITSNVYRIVARGNAYTGGTAIQDFALLKAAETAKATGHNYFQIVSSNNATSTSIGQTAGFSQTNVYGAAAFTTYTPGYVYDIIKPGQDLYIRVFTLPRGTSPPPGSYSAAEIIANIGPRVKRADN